MHGNDANLVTQRDCDVRCPNFCAGLQATGIGAAAGSCGGSATAGTSVTETGPVLCFMGPG